MADDDPLGARVGRASTRGAQLAFDDLGVPLEEASFVVVDLETTGGRPAPNSIADIGAVREHRGGKGLPTQQGNGCQER